MQPGETRTKETIKHQLPPPPPPTPTSMGKGGGKKHMILANCQRKINLKFGHMMEKNVEIDPQEKL